MCCSDEFGRRKIWFRYLDLWERERDRAMRYEDKIVYKGEGWKMDKNSWLEKKRQDWANRYRIERRKFYNRYVWGKMVKERSKDRDVERNIVRREKDLQIQWEDSKIREAKYNKR